MSHDPAQALAAVTDVEHAAHELGRVDLVMRADLVRALALHRMGQVAAGARIERSVNRWAADHGHRPLLARSHLQLTWFFTIVGDSAAQLEHALRGLESLDEDSPARTRAGHLQALAAALITNGSIDEAWSRFQMAEDIATDLGELELQIKLLNNRSYAEHLTGEPQAAMDSAERMLALAAEHDIELGATALDTVACAQMAVGRYAEAEQTLLGVVEKREGIQGDPEVAQVLLTLAQAQRMLGATERARATLDRCMAECEKRGLSAVRVRILQERAELFALDGSFQEAYEQYKMFHADSESLLSVERDTRARTLQAVFETDEARKDSLRFREMSLRDPLTGLYNRRYVDERLDAIVRAAGNDDTALSICLIDLDHFKTVNDTFSHAVGDEMLKKVAGLLAEGLAAPAFVARMGGEEFLLVLPGAGNQEAVAHCEAARCRLRNLACDAVTDGFTITGSFGVTTVTGGETPGSALLAAADRNLYAAKRAGRDRVVADPA